LPRQGPPGNAGTDPRRRQLLRDVAPAGSPYNDSDSPVRSRPRRAMALKLPVPTNLITGYLGAGQTTAILDLLRNHSAGKRWAVLVNELGEFALDHLMLQSTGVDGLYIRELAGGCICCTLSLPLQASITHLIREAKPDHLLIESTGAGHPAGVL